MTTQTRAVLLSLICVLVLAACSSAPEYTPAPEVQATREAAEYERSVTRGQQAWYIGVGLLSTLGIITLFLAAFLARVGYRYQAAKAAAEEAKARRLRLVDLGEGRVLELIPGDEGQGVIHGVSWQAAPEVIPAEPAPVLERRGRKPPTGLQAFVIEAAGVVGWNSDVFPRWDRWQEHDFECTAQRWVEATDELEDMGLVVKVQGRATSVTGGNDLVWLYRQLERAAPPTPPAEQYKSSL